QRLVAEVLADQAQADAFLKQMGGVRMTKRVRCRESIDRAGGARQTISRLHGTDAHEGRRLVHELAQGQRAISPTTARRRKEPMLIAVSEPPLAEFFEHGRSD